MSNELKKPDMISDEASERMAESAERIRDEARQTAEHLKQAGHAEANVRLDQAGSGLETTASRLRNAASELEGKDAWIGTLLERGADTAEQAGRYLSGQDMNSVVSDAQSLARRNPGAFLGGAAALGFLLARAGKATVERADTDRVARAAQGSETHPAPAAPMSAPARPEDHAPMPTPTMPPRSDLNGGTSR